MSSLSGSTTGASGRKADVAPECLKDYKDLKTKRKYKFMTIKIEDESFTLVTEKKGGKNDTIDQFLGSLPHSRCRYLVYDQQYKNPEGRIIEKLFYIIWTPGSAPSRERILYSSQKFATTEYFTGVEEIQASTKDDLRELLTPPTEKDTNEDSGQSSDSDE
eukprot:gb/GECG01010183.1/.p1 GENE.gb/GECG01010183.1/~~gb/GECG01010183.1/.p1  ORF type:complete len:161 (+),score=26.01 gb/GECG01010183.1/:1-483(+)